MDLKRKRNDDEIIYFNKKITSQSDWKNQLENNGFTIIKNPVADGNCFYRAISYYLYKTEDHWSQIKTISLNWIMKNQNFIMDNQKDFKTNILYSSNETVEEYLNRHKKSNEWADSNTIYSLSFALNLNIKIIYDHLKGYNTYNIKNKNEVWLYHLNRNHFVLLNSKNNSSFIKKLEKSDKIFEL